MNGSNLGSPEQINKPSRSAANSSHKIVVIEEIAENEDDDHSVNTMGEEPELEVIEEDGDTSSDCDHSYVSSNNEEGTNSNKNNSAMTRMKTM